jgi:hypothetical protein
VYISIETRPEVGENFAPVASLFKQFELIYVVGDERDIVGAHQPPRRGRTCTASRRRRRMRAPVPRHLERINALADQAEFIIC